MVSEIKNKVTQSNSFIDESFDVKRTSNYQLTLQIGTEGVLLAVTDKIKNKYIAFEKYAFQNVYDFTSIPELIDTIKKDSKLVAQEYKSVTCLVVNNISTLVPIPLFENEKKSHYLNFNTSYDSSATVKVDDIKGLDAKNIFAIPAPLKNKLDSLYTNISYHHYSSVLLDNLLLENKNQTGKKIYVHVQSGHFEVVYIEGKKLIFYNTFQHHSAEDFMYYLLFACEQLQLNPENMEVILLGEIERNSGLYSLAQKYIRNLKFGERKSVKDYGFQLQTLPKHFYFTLFSDYDTH